MSCRQKSEMLYEFKLSVFLRLWRSILVLGGLLAASVTAEAGSRILATGGGSQIEGAGGGGLVPWAAMSSYASNDEYGGTAFITEARFDDYRLSVYGASFSAFNRFEVSVAQQRFDLTSQGAELSQNIYGLKARVFGDLIYEAWPQVALGIQHKQNKTFAIPGLFGATDDSGTDFYLSAAKIWLNGPLNRNWLGNFTLRATKANETGLVGFGGPGAKYEFMAEASLAVLLNRYLAAGVEYRQKPDHLAVGEQDWKDIFIAVFPTKSVAIVAAYVDLGKVAGVTDQQGFYASIQASF
ncbi:MAG: DUF3034 family protein [Pseudomonadales bacterium]|nr:DUF3034 family protein [Pseudomonadales bacterium]